MTMLGTHFEPQHGSGRGPIGVFDTVLDIFAYVVIALVIIAVVAGLTLLGREHAGLYVLALGVGLAGLGLFYRMIRDQTR